MSSSSIDTPSVKTYNSSSISYAIGSASLAAAILAIAVTGVFIAQSLVKSGTLPGKLHLFKFVTDLDWKVAAYIAGGVGAGAIAFGTAAGVGFAKSRHIATPKKPHSQTAPAAQPTSNAAANSTQDTSKATQPTTPTQPTGLTYDERRAASPDNIIAAGIKRLKHIPSSMDQSNWSQKETIRILATYYVSRISQLNMDDEAKNTLYRLLHCESKELGVFSDQQQDDTVPERIPNKAAFAHPMQDTTNIQACWTFDELDCCISALLGSTQKWHDMNDDENTEFAINIKQILMQMTKQSKLSREEAQILENKFSGVDAYITSNSSFN